MTRYCVMNEFTRFLAETARLADSQITHYVGRGQRAAEELPRLMKG